MFFAGAFVGVGLLLAGLTRTWVRDIGVPLIWGIAALALMLEMGRHQPMQYVLTAAGIAGAAGLLCSVWTPGQVLPIWGAAAVWVTAILGARGTARWILCRWSGEPRFGLMVLALSSVIASAVLEMAMGNLRWIPGIPAPVSVLVAAGGVQLLATPWFLEKRTLLPVICSGPAVLLGLAIVVAGTARLLLGP